MSEMVFIFFFFKVNSRQSCHVNENESIRETTWIFDKIMVGGECV